MTTVPESTPTPLEAASMQVLQSFAAVCAAPDDETVADGAEAALRHLDDLLRAV
ncbi:hypothetical protein GA0070216_13710 [Micromonospora matsumotoense]|uniref:Uncharacterized protein n=1 Tax=Micromonospora matsumotoense TaxID=121616 RepID=A0A1C5AWT7_9ACTN|nr:hypothetical protein [Micromonospora matsumotoense]SCF49695.1 hypothetical protein GA0070216_13710 [Micromonospora matsumotoense]